MPLKLDYVVRETGSNLGRNITITLAVQFGTTLFFVACVNVFESEPGVGVWEAEVYQIFLVFVAVVLLCNIISAFGNKYLPMLDVSFAPSCPVLQMATRPSFMSPSHMR